MIQKSASHSNTTGCRFEQDFKYIIENGQQVDNTLLRMETKHLSHCLLTDEGLCEGQPHVSAWLP